MFLLFNRDAYVVSVMYRLCLESNWILPNLLLEINCVVQEQGSTSDKLESSLTLLMTH